MTLGKRWLRRGGRASASGRMIAALQMLRAAKAAGYPFAALDTVHALTIKALVRRDWIFRSKGPDGVKYTITGRGKMALAAFLRPVRYFDGLCPCCRTTPRHQSARRRYDYCLACYRAKQKLYQQQWKRRQHHA